jgi:molecular chaperone GrpE
MTNAKPTPESFSLEPDDALFSSPETPAQAAPENETIASLIASMTAIEAEKNELKERLLRALADTENLRRRAEKDVQDARLYGITAFAKDMVNVADNLRRAMESLPEGSVPEGFQPLTEGLDLTERDLLKTLERHGIRKIEPRGEKFDPHAHQAMFEAPNPDIPNGYVMEVIQPGFSIGERILRPALVGVARNATTASNGQAVAG